MSAISSLSVAVLFTGFQSNMIPHIHFQEPVSVNSPLFISPLPKTPITPEAIATPTPIERPSWSEFQKTAQDLATIYNFPAKVLIAQAAVESARGTSDFAVNRNNYFGIAAYDWNPDNATAFENYQQGIIAYLMVIKNNFPEAWESRNDPEKLLGYLVFNHSGVVYATDPDYISKVESTQEWSQY